MTNHGKSRRRCAGRRGGGSRCGATRQNIPYFDSILTRAQSEARPRTKSVPDQGGKIRNRGHGCWISLLSHFPSCFRDCINAITRRCTIPKNLGSMSLGSCVRDSSSRFTVNPQIDPIRTRGKHDNYREKRQWPSICCLYGSRRFGAIVLL